MDMLAVRPRMWEMYRIPIAIAALRYGCNPQSYHMQTLST